MLYKISPTHTHTHTHTQTHKTKVIQNATAKRLKCCNEKHKLTVIP